MRAWRRMPLGSQVYGTCSVACGPAADSPHAYQYTMYQISTCAWLLQEWSSVQLHMSRYRRGHDTTSQGAIAAVHMHGLLPGGWRRDTATPPHAHSTTTPAVVYRRLHTVCRSARGLSFSWFSQWPPPSDGCCAPPRVLVHSKSQSCSQPVPAVQPASISSAVHSRPPIARQNSTASA
eukprot:SAG31_NODE_91_length_26366_cov_6.792211_6_plen_178_part_00